MDSTEQKISKRVERELNQTKVVVRHLPPDITEEIFLEKFSPLPPENFTNLYFAAGDPDLGPQGCARAYINFTDETAILAFRDQFDGMVLESQKGYSYRALIEYAPFQNVPKKPRKKLDSRCGTMDQDGDYQSFLQGREERTPTMAAVDFETYIEELKASQVEEVQVTPLIAYLRNKKTASKSSKKKQVFVVEKKKKKSAEKGKEGGKVSRSRYDLDDKEGSRKDSEQKVGRKVDVDGERGGARGVAEYKKSSQGSERSLQEGQKNGDVGRRERERNRSGGSRKPDRALYAPKSRDQRSQESRSKSRSQETADISWTDDVKKPHLNNDTPHSDRHSSGYDYYAKSSDYSRGRGRGRGRGKGRGRGRGQYTSHETTRTAPNH